MRIGDEELTLPQVENLVEIGKDASSTIEKANALLERNESAVYISNLLDMLSPDNQMAMTEALKYVLECQQQGKAATSVDEILNARGVDLEDVPEGHTQVPLSLFESPEATTVYVRQLAFEKKMLQRFEQQQGLITQMQQHIGNVLQSTQRQTVAQIASQRLGIDVTPQMIAEWADKGITDVLKAIDAGILKRVDGGGGEGTRAAPMAQRPVSAPAGGSGGKVIPADADLADVDRMWAQGARFAPDESGKVAEASYKQMRGIV